MFDPVGLLLNEPPARASCPLFSHPAAIVTIQRSRSESLRILRDSFDYTDRKERHNCLDTRTTRPQEAIDPGVQTSHLDDARPVRSLLGGMDSPATCSLAFPTSVGERG